MQDAAKFHRRPILVVGILLIRWQISCFVAYHLLGTPLLISHAPFSVIGLNQPWKRLSLNAECLATLSLFNIPGVPSGRELPCMRCGNHQVPSGTICPINSNGDRGLGGGEMIRILSLQLSAVRQTPRGGGMRQRKWPSLSLTTMAASRRI